MTDVSWFDAILAANARSRRDGLDSVYEFHGIDFREDGGVSGLDGFTSHLDRPGWRLPTEAEWEACARAGSTIAWSWGDEEDSIRSDRYAWFRENAGGQSHPVGTKDANGWGLHDMAGNVMEWVQDWKSAFPRDTVVDFAGAEAPAEIPEVPLKGGSFAHGRWNLRPSCRSATYAAFRSSRAEYVGFRLVRGGFEATTTHASGLAVQTPPVTVELASLPSLLGVREARVVFLNRSSAGNNLSWIDFADPDPVVRSLPDPDPVFHPAISPDGRWVAWSTGLEGAAESSRIKIRRLTKMDTMVLDLGEGAIPRWWTSGSDTFLLRGSTMDNTDPAWGTLSTTAQRWADGRLQGPVEVWGRGGFHDGRSGPWLFSGYRRLVREDLRTGNQQVLFAGPQNGKISGDTSQVCNASVSPDSSGRVLLLDFGYPGPSTVVGRAYGIHEIAFVVDSAGKAVRFFPAPEGQVQWDHMEWSNQSRWAVSGSIDGSGARRNLHVLDLEKGVSTPILSGEDLWHPALWLGRAAVPALPSQADPDSAGAWNIPATDYTQEEFAIKARAFRQMSDSVDIVAIGSSRIKAGIDPSSFIHGKAFNWGFSGADPVADRVVLENYVVPHTPGLRAVIVSLMPGWWFDWRGELAWKNIIASVGFRYDAAHGFWSGGVPEGFDRIVADRTFEGGAAFDRSGGTVLGSGWWDNGGLPPCTPPLDEDLSGAVFQKNWADIEAMAATCQARGVHLLLVNFPQDPKYSQTACMGKYGPTWSTWNLLKDRITDLVSRVPMVRFIDAHADGLHDYPDSAATNFDHLSWKGAKQLSHRLDSIIAQLP